MLTMSKIYLCFASINERTGKALTGNCMVSEYCFIGADDVLYEVRPTPKVRFVGRVTELLNMIFLRRGVLYAFGKTPLDAKQQLSAKLCQICEEKKAEYDRAARLYNSVALMEKK